MRDARLGVLCLHNDSATHTAKLLYEVTWKTVWVVEEGSFGVVVRDVKDILVRATGLDMYIENIVLLGADMHAVWVLCKRVGRQRY